MAVPPPDHDAPPGAPADAAAATKVALRAEMRRARDAFVAGHAAAGHRPAIAPLPPLLALFRPGLVVAGYAAFGSEADPAPLLAAAHARGCALALPHVTARDEPMRFLAWKPGQALAAGLFGLSQPDEAASELTPDLVLAPLVAFDAALNRLGMGAGFYDRALAALPHVLRIGVAWSIQQVAHVPTEPWDAPLNAIITEREWITAK